MFNPQFNKVLVEIEQSVEDQYGTGNNDSMLGASYNKGKLLKISSVMFPYGDTQNIAQEGMETLMKRLNDMVDTTIMWHEGTEAGTVFEENDKKYGLIYWFDIIGVKE